MPSDSKHSAGKRAKFSSTSFDDLPVEVQSLILEKVPKISGKYPQALFNLSSTCKTLRDILNQPESQKTWEEAWQSVKQHRHAAEIEEIKLNNGLEYSAKQKLRLAGFTGCMICKAKGIRKVTWEFGVRCCKECLIHNTIAEYYLSKDYDLPPTALSQLAYLYVSGYNRYLGATRWKTYWRSSLIPVLQSIHGVSSLQEYEGLKAERARIAAEKLKQVEKEMEEKRKQLEKEKEEKRAKAAEEEAIKETLRRERKAIFDAWLMEDNVDVSFATYSQTYERNSYRATKLQRKNYEKLLKRIVSEICEAASCLTKPKQSVTDLNVAQELLVKDMMAKKEAKRIAEEQAELAQRVAKEKQAEHLRLAQQRKREAQLARRVAATPTLTCSVCGGPRLFILLGLRDHTRAVHPQQIPEALGSFF